jgi:hypothetical protein
LGPALDRLYTHDPTALLACIVARARLVFDVQTRQPQLANRRRDAKDVGAGLFAARLSNGNGAMA